MAIVSLVLMAAGSVGLIIAVVLEIIFGEPIYMLFTKIFPWVFGVGGVLFGYTTKKRMARMKEDT